MGVPGVTAGVLASWDVDEAKSCGGWIVWQILGGYNRTLNCVKPCQEQTVNLGGVFHRFEATSPCCHCGGD